MNENTSLRTYQTLQQPLVLKLNHLVPEVPYFIAKLYCHLESSVLKPHATQP